MKKTTFKNKQIIKTLNNEFYVVYFNGEEKKDITFLGKQFVYKPSGSKTGTHELAKELALINNKIKYPTTTFLNSKLEIDLQINSYINSKNMNSILDNILLKKK
jgi:thioredoxin-related protein